MKTISSRYLFLLVLLPLYAKAASIDLGDHKLQLSGGVSGGLFASSNTGSEVRDNLTLNDVLLDVSVKPFTQPGLGFLMTIGGYAGYSVYEGGIGRAFDETFNAFNVRPRDLPSPFHHASLSLSASKELHLDLGIIPTNIGLESGTSFKNDNVLRGMIWYAQPGYYRGIRARYTPDAFGLFAEFNQDSSQSAGKSLVVGSDTTLGGIKMAATYSYGKGGNDILDFIVGLSAGKTDINLNLDVFFIENAPADTSSTAIGMALYLKHSLGKLSLPLRAEYIVNGDTSIYSNSSGSLGDYAYSMTFSPTFHLTKTTFIRGEIAAVNAQLATFSDSDGVLRSSQISTSIQFAHRF